MCTSIPRLCGLRIYLIVPNTTGNKSAARHARGRSAGSDNGGPALAFTHSSNQTPREVFQSLQEPRSFPHLMFSPLASALRSKNFKGEKTSSALATERKD